MKKTLLTAICALLCSMAFAQKQEIIKTGINLGPLPVVAFDADRGFQFGALMNIYDFGDGKSYPNPNSQWYFEGSAYVKESNIGSYLFRAEYDNKTLIPGVRMSICAGYYKDAALDFYGFNGNQSNYDMGLIADNITFNTETKAGAKLEKKFLDKGKAPKGFYRFSRDLIRFKADFTGKILKNFYWEAGYNFNWFKTGSFTPSGYSSYTRIGESSLRSRLMADSFLPCVRALCTTAVT